MDLYRDTEALSVDELESEISTLSAHIYAATYRLLVLIREFDERGAWGQAGAKSMAHWLNWRVGLGLGAAREKVRVAHALADLPQLSGAFSRGEISYSKVRALTRIVTSESEAEMLEMSRYGTASQMERLVRGIRQAKRAEDDAFPRELQDRRELVTWDLDDGCFVVRVRFTPEEGAMFMQALDKAMQIVKQSGHEDEPRERFASQRADALTLMAESFLAHEAKSVDRYQAVVHVSAGTSYLEDGAPLAEATTRRILCDSAVVAMKENDEGEPLSIGRKRRTMNTAIRRALRKRDGGCRFPGCGQTQFVDAHHIEHWADGGETSLDNLVLLCRHHHRQLHEGGWKLERRDDGKLLFFDQWNELVPEAYTLRRAELEALYAAHAALDVSAETYRLNCMDERMDLDHAVWAMMQKSSRSVCADLSAGGANYTESFDLPLRSSQPLSRT